MANLTDRYDLIMIGAGLEGLICAGIVARRGRRVLVLDESGEVGGASFRVDRKGYTFINGPSLFMGFERDGLYDRLLNELGISLSFLKKENNLIERTHPPFQLVLPDHRLDFFNNSALLLEELSREFPDRVQEIKGLWKESEEPDRTLYTRHILTRPPRPATFKDWSQEFKERWRYSSAVRSQKNNPAEKVLGQHGVGAEMTRALETLCLFFFGKNISEASGLELTRLIGMIQREIVTIKGGIPALAPLLADSIGESRGKVLLKRSVAELVFRGRSLDGIRTGDGEVFHGNNVVVNRPWQLGGEDSGRHVFSMYFGISGDVLPVPMKSHLFLMRTYGKKTSGQNMLYLRLNPGLPGPAVPKEKKGLQVTGFLEGEEGPRDSIRAGLIKSVKENLEWLIPFSNGHIELLGEDLGQTEADTRISLKLAEQLRPTRAVSREGGRYFQTTRKRLYLLPDHGRLPVATLDPGRSAVEMANRILKN